MQPAPFRYEPGVLHLLDQTRLPSDEVWLRLTDAEAVAEAIASLRVRGAPAIGVAAAYGLAAAARGAQGDRDALEAAAVTIRNARPTAVNLGWAVDRVLAAARKAVDADREATVEAEARAIHDFEVAACAAMGRLGAGLLPAQVRALTYCNTGALATGGIGTAFGVLRVAHERGQLMRMWACETRPLLQGARLTVWEAERLGMPCTLVVDGVAGSLFADGRIDVVVVGADRIAANGDVANKIGTYAIAVLARHHGVPFYVVAPSSTLDPCAPDGAAIPIEQRPSDEVRRVGATPVAPAGATVHNPAFDVTPAELVSAIVTEQAVFLAPYDFSSG